MGNVVFQDDTWTRLEEYTRLCPVEIACMGYATLDEGNVVVDDVFLVPQEISLSSVEFLEKGLPYAVKKALKEDRLDELRFCWHSHATHGAFFSPIDEDMVRKVRDASPIPWYANVVLNKKGETHAQLDYFSPEGELAHFANHITVELGVQIEGRADNTAARMVEIEEFCDRKQSSKTTTKSSTKSSSKSDDKPPLEQVPEQEYRAECGPRDWRLHNEAKTKSWDVYIKDDMAYYWVPESGEFMGSAPIPIDKDGNRKTDLQATVVNAPDVNKETDPELVPLDDAEEELLNAAINAGML